MNGSIVHICEAHQKADQTEKENHVIIKGEKMDGKVWLVGAGPGDPGLFTLRGREVLAQAQVVVYDALVGAGVLTMIPEEAEKINVGKRSGNHIMAQEEINLVLLNKALEGKRVVRLKGGDPFVFGRGGEELELLEENGVEYEIVPGVTSAFAVPAYNGIPVTHRDYCSSVHIITGHKRKGAGYDIDFEALVRTKGTLVFLMGLAAMPEILDGLTGAGLSPDCPAAVLSHGTTAHQQRVVATVGTLYEQTIRAGITAPAIIVVGEVCRLEERFAWVHKRPLAGRQILVTRPKELVSVMAQKLREKGAQVLELPAIETRPCTPNPKLEELLSQIPEKGPFDWIVFTSPSGVRIFFEQLTGKWDVRLLAGTKIAAIGEGTRKALMERGLLTDFVPSVYDGITLGKELALLCRGGERILIPRAKIGNEALPEELAKVSGVCVYDVPIYDTLCTSSSVVDERKLIEDGEIDYAVFTSASTVRGFAGALEGLDFSKVNAVCIGKQTKAAADALGMHTWMAEKATMDSVVERICRLCAGNT